MAKKLFLLALLSGCGPEPTQDVARELPKAFNEGARFKVALVGVIEDKIAYGNRRGIYLITDTETGTEFVGVSGVGITETSAHSESRGSGKTHHMVTVPDER